MNGQDKLWAARRNVMDMIVEAVEADDPDLWDELDSKITDVLVVYRRSQSSLPKERPVPVQLTPGQLAEMAFCSAVADFAMEIEEEES